MSKMVKKIIVEGYEEFTAKVKAPEFEGMTKFCLFTGSLDPTTNESWCSDTRTFEPVVTKKMETLEGKNVIFISCFVGGLDSWKNKQNPFRTDTKLNLSEIPTFLKYGSPQKLVDDQLNEAMIERMFKEDDDDN